MICSNCYGSCECSSSLVRQSPFCCSSYLSANFQMYLLSRIHIEFFLKHLCRHVYTHSYIAHSHTYFYSYKTVKKNIYTNEYCFSPLKLARHIPSIIIEYLTFQPLIFENIFREIEKIWCDTTLFLSVNLTVYSDLR